jgi:phospholipid/cholesterol/gamma-HCH transport system ATP-binding protein
MLFEGKIVWTGSAQTLLASDNIIVDQFTHGRRQGPIQMALRK